MESMNGLGDERCLHKSIEFIATRIERLPKYKVQLVTISTS